MENVPKHTSNMKRIIPLFTVSNDEYLGQNHIPTLANCFRDVSTLATILVKLEKSLANPFEKSVGNHTKTPFSTSHISSMLSYRILVRNVGKIPNLSWKLPTS